MRLQLESHDDLFQAAALASWLDRPSVSEVVVTLPWLDTDERSSSAQAIRRLFNDCGCAVGSISAMATVAAVLLPQVLTRGWSWPAVGSAVGAGVAAAVAGKLAGLAWSRWRLRARLRLLAQPRSGPPETGQPRSGQPAPRQPARRWGGLGKAKGP